MSFVWQTLSKGKQRDYREKYMDAVRAKYIMIPSLYDENCKEWLKGVVKSW